MTHIKYVFSSLKKDFSKLVAIIIIVLLGIGFMAGLLQAGPDLQDSQDKFYKETKLADIRLSISTGISKNSYDKIISSLDESAYYTPEISYETTTYNENNVSNYSLFYQRELTSVDKLQIKEGRLPENKNEVVVLTDNVNFVNWELGSKLYTKNPELELTVVGKAVSSEYITKQIVNSQSSGRRLQNIFYFDISYFDNIDYYTSININYNLIENTYKDEYKEIINEKITKFESLFTDEFLKTNFLDLAKASVEFQLDSSLLANGLTEETLALYKLTDEYKNYLNSSLEQAYEQHIEENGSIKTYILTRDECYSYVMLDNDIQKVITVASIFPVFFFLIAMLVASTSVSRIITKDRSLMGTFKGLGLTNSKIRSKYIFYGFLATIIGTAFGLFIGLFLLTYVIYVCYKSIYILPTFLFGLDPFNIIFVVTLMFVFIMSVILFYSFITLREKPSLLLMEKAPKPGKKILLERIKPLWNIFPFGIKNMFRNVFRFKKNLIMMIIGVGGSTALMMAGFGMRDSIFVLTNDQYKDIFRYNFIVETNDNTISDEFELSSPVGYFVGGTINDETTYSFNVMSGDSLDEFIKLDSEFSSSSVIVTTTLANHFKLKTGQDFSFTINNKDYTYKLSGVTENYVGNYIYLGEDFSNDFPYNAIIGFQNIQESEVNDFVANLFTNESVNNVIYTGDSIAVYDGLLSNLNYIVIILILLSGLLMITVIYNLVDINISERKKEIATLKVIGYHRHELVMYIFREILLMTFISMLFGLAFGVLLHRYIVLAINSPNLMFALKINWMSYLYTIILSIVFSIIVTAILIPKILKVDMVESLKSVD